MTMIEKVARAIADKQHKDWAYSEASKLCDPEKLKTTIAELNEAAKAAIEAMKEPTEEMMNSAIRYGVDIGFGVGYPEYKDLYKVMIEAALKQ